MFYSQRAALRCVAQFYHDLPLAFVAASPHARHASEQHKSGTRVAGNTLRSRTVRSDCFLYEQIVCTIEDPLGIVLARWWLRKRSAPELLTGETRHGSETSSYETSEAKESGESRALLLKDCRLYLRCLGGAGTQASKYVLSLGELMTFGIVERIDMSCFRLQATNEQLYPFLGQPVGLRVIHIRHVNVDMGELFTLLAANASTLLIVELSSYQLPTLQFLAFLPNVRELELRNTSIVSQPIAIRSEGADVPVVPSAKRLLSAASPGTFVYLSALHSLEKLDFSGLRSNLDFAGLLGCVSLRSLNLSSSVVTDKDLAEIAKLKGLQDLFLSRTAISNAGALSECSSLQAIQLAHTDVTTEGIKTLENLRDLRQLDLAYTRVASVNHLAASKSLLSLNIWKTCVTTDGIDLLGGLTTLQQLFAGDNEIRDIKGLRGCPSLRRLSLQSTLVTTAGIASLETLTELEELNLSNTLVTDVSVLKETKALRKLDLTGARVTTEGLRTLKDLPLLNTITIAKTDVETLEELHGCPELREVIGKRCRLLTLEGAQGIPHLSTLVATHCPVSSVGPLKECAELTSLNLWGCQITQDGIAELGKCRALQDVDLAETLVHNVEPLFSCSQLSTLVLYSSKLKSIDGIGALQRLSRLDISNTAVVCLAPLVHCTALEILNVSDTDMDDEGFQGVEQLSALKTLLLSSTRVTRIGQIGLCSELVEVHAGKCPITSAGIEGIEGARKLEKLNLSYTEVATGATRLGCCCRLEKLNLKFTRVPQEDVEHLRSCLPRCHILSY